MLDLLITLVAFTIFYLGDYYLTLYYVTADNELNPAIKEDIRNGNLISVSHHGFWIIGIVILIGVYFQYSLGFPFFQGLLLFGGLIMLGRHIENLLIKNVNRHSVLQENRRNERADYLISIYSFVPFVLIAIFYFIFFPNMFSLGCVVGALIPIYNLWKWINKIYPATTV